MPPATGELGQANLRLIGHDQLAESTKAGGGLLKVRRRLGPLVFVSGDFHLRFCQLSYRIGQG